MRVVTATGLRLGLAKRVFAREPKLPSDVEAEEEEQVKDVQSIHHSGSSRALPNFCAKFKISKELYGHVLEAGSCATWGTTAEKKSCRVRVVPLPLSACLCRLLR